MQEEGRTGMRASHQGLTIMLGVRLSILCSGCLVNLLLGRSHIAKSQLPHTPRWMAGGRDSGGAARARAKLHRKVGRQLGTRQRKPSMRCKLLGMQ